MTELAVIRGAFSDWRPVKSRSVLQLVIEVPIEQTQEVLDRLGVPIPGVEKWVAVALLKADAAPVEQTKPVNDDDGEVRRSAEERRDQPQRKWSSMKPSQQAGMLCADPLFLRFIIEEHEDGATDPAEWVRWHCEVKSRLDLDINGYSAGKWNRLAADFFRWKNEPIEGVSP